MNAISDVAVSIKLPLVSFALWRIEELYHLSLSTLRQSGKISSDLSEKPVVSSMLSLIVFSPEGQGVSSSRPGHGFIIVDGNHPLTDIQEEMYGYSKSR